MKKLKENVYQCDHCLHVLKTERGMTKHENNCTENVDKNNEENKLLTERRAQVEDIRCTSKSIHEVITRLQAFWLSCGLRVKFDSYPSSFSKSVRNSHNSPKGYPQNWCSQDKTIPNGYPGWAGNWAGTVEIIDREQIGKNSVYFGDLCRDYHSDLKLIPGVHFIKYGTGGGGDKFGYDGMMFLYDFPAMHEEFRQNGEEFNVLQDNHVEAIKNYNYEYDKKLSEFIIKDTEHQYINTVSKELNNLIKSLYDAKQKMEASLTNKFNSKYKVDLVLPNTMFADDKGIMQTKCKIDYIENMVHPDLKQIAKHVIDLQEKVARYKNDNPEFFV